jgi:hypothetical protein
MKFIPFEFNLLSDKFKDKLISYLIYESDWEIYFTPTSPILFLLREKLIIKKINKNKDY